MNEALQLLPVYLAGCRKLLILAGSTYTSRIWCVMEIFTFLQVGKSPEDIEIIAITPGDTAQEKARAAANGAEVARVAKRAAVEAEVDPYGNRGRKRSHNPLARCK